MIDAIIPNNVKHPPMLVWKVLLTLVIENAYGLPWYLIREPTGAP